MAPRESPDAVHIEQLVKSYGGPPAVDGLGFTARTAEVTAVLGPNGAGKTTTLEICEGFRSRDGGTVSVLGLDPGERRHRQALSEQVGVMLQNNGVYVGAKAGEALAGVAAFHRDPLPVGALLQRLGLTEVAGRRWKQLSGGQQQRLSLAMAVVGRPRLVFLDEPTAGLDVQARQATWELVRELRASGVSVVLTTHAMDEAEALADHVVIVDRGRVVADGSVPDLTRGEAVGELRFRAGPGLNLEQLLNALPEGMSAKESPAGQYLIEGSIDPQVLSTVTSWAATQRTLLEDLRVERRSLEEVFLELTGRDLRS